MTRLLRYTCVLALSPSSSRMEKKPKRSLPFQSITKEILFYRKQNNKKGTNFMCKLYLYSKNDSMIY